MSKVLDWFTAMLIDLDDEEEYVAIGRSLLSVQRYVVTPAHTVPSMAEVFWKEVESLAEQSQEGNIIIVMPDFLIENPDEVNRTFYPFLACVCVYHCTDGCVHASVCEGGGCENQGGGRNRESMYVSVTV